MEIAGKDKSPEHQYMKGERIWKMKWRVGKDSKDKILLANVSWVPIIYQEILRSLNYISPLAYPSNPVR